MIKEEKQGKIYSDWTGFIIETEDNNNYYKDKSPLPRGIKHGDTVTFTLDSFGDPINIKVIKQK